LSPPSSLSLVFGDEARFLLSTVGFFSPGAQSSSLSLIRIAFPGENLGVPGMEFMSSITKALAKQFQKSFEIDRDNFLYI
jgi:hypothetical protein